MKGTVDFSSFVVQFRLGCLYYICLMIWVTLLSRISLVFSSIEVVESNNYILDNVFVSYSYGKHKFDHFLGQFSNVFSRAIGELSF